MNKIAASKIQTVRRCGDKLILCRIYSLFAKGGGQVDNAIATPKGQFYVNIKTILQQARDTAYEQVSTNMYEVYPERKYLQKTSQDINKDPYVLEFLDLKDNKSFRESDLESTLIDKIQEFLLELGRGFAFVDRQKRIQTEHSDFYIDLVFYNYILKCFVIIDLKRGKLTHQNVGQMDMYVRMFDDLETSPEDNPTIGIILCTEKDNTVVKYSVIDDKDNLFVSKYQMYLPTEEELRAEIKRMGILLLFI